MFNYIFLFLLNLFYVFNLFYFHIIIDNYYFILIIILLTLFNTFDESSLAQSNIQKNGSVKKRAK